MLDDSDLVFAQAEGYVRAMRDVRVVTPIVGLFVGIRCFLERESLACGEECEQPGHAFYDDWDDDWGWEPTLTYSECLEDEDDDTEWTH